MMTNREDIHFERDKWRHELARREAERAHDASGESGDKLNEAAISSGQLALRTAVLVNSGAAVSVLAFIGSLISQGRVGVSEINSVATSLMWFAFGVASAVAGMAASYLTNFLAASAIFSRVHKWDHPYVEDTRRTIWLRRIGAIFDVGAITLGVGSLVLFIIGMVDVRRTIDKLSPTAQSISTPAKP
jgi:hypothetical protein